jgi:hypothetical protein
MDMLGMMMASSELDVIKNVGLKFSVAENEEYIS